MSPSQHLTIERAISRAKKAVKKGNTALALKLYNSVLQNRPNHPVAKKGLHKIQKELPRNQSTQVEIPSPSQDQINALISIYHSGQLVKTEQLCRELLTTYPQSVVTINVLGVALHGQGKLQEAVASYDRAIQIRSDFADAYNNRGNALNDLWRLEDALASCDKAIQIRPDYAEAYNNRGNALKGLGRLEDALASCDKAIQIRPDYAKAYNNRGNVLKGMGRLEDALASYDKAIQIRPDFAEAYNNFLLILNYTPTFSHTYHLEMARKFGVITTKKAQPPFSTYKCTHSPQKLRIGLVSGDLYSHPVGYFLEGVLSHIDNTTIELIAYPTTLTSDNLSERIKPYFSNWKPIYGRSDENAASSIHNDGVHILFDLSGHTAHNRLQVFGWKPSPIQVSWLGYFATTGVRELDYLIGDPYLTPPEYDKHFTEKIWRLPETRWCFTPPDVDIAVTTPPILTNNYITFGCFNNLSKINDRVIDLWIKILNAIPNSRLFLKNTQFHDPTVCKIYIKKFITQGISIERLLFEASENRELYLAAYNRVDIALDPFPFTGGTTTAECLWMGVPVLTLSGDSLVSRQGIGILMNAGLSDWIANSKEEYIAKSIIFASDLHKLTMLRTTMRSQVLSSPLFDASHFSNNFENAVWKMWHHYIESI